MPTEQTEKPMPNITDQSRADRRTVRVRRAGGQRAIAPSVVSAALAFGLFCATLLMATTAQAAGGGGDKTMEAVWQGVNLVLILGAIIYFGRGPITTFFSSRRAEIKSELSEAANLLSEAEQRNAELQRRLVDLNSEVEGIREAANQRADDEAERILADARATAERIRNDAKAAVAQELSRAQSKLREEAANLALEIAAQKLEANVGDGDRDRLIDEFILRVDPSSDGRTDGRSSEGAN